MCGISAIISKSSGGEDLQDELKDLLEKISHRGDSKKEYAIFGDHGLGCVRLKIVDQDYSVQPILNENGTIAVVFNGEIYNYLVLKKDLEEKGHKFKTGGDTEVIVHLFEEYGKEMIFRLEGMFAFIILDIQNNKFFAARDFFGVKPLHYCQSPEKTYFSSELKSFLQLPVEEYFEIPPGHFLTDEGLVKYYDLKVLPLHEQPFDTLKQEVRRLLDKAIEKRVQTELPIGVFLSGGVDSSITLLRALIFNKNIVAIIIGTEESEDVTNGIKLCEENNIQYVHINIPHQTLVGKIEEIIGIVESFETVVVRASCYSFFLSKVAQEKGIKVVLCGEGADEVFGGYGDFLEPNNDRDFQELTLEFISGLARSQLLRIDKCLMLRQFLQTIAE